MYINEINRVLDSEDKVGTFACSRRASNPLFPFIQLGTAKCGAALPHSARIERLARVRVPK